MTQTPRACILSVSGPDLLRGEADFLARVQPWGVILMGRSCVSRVQVRSLVEDIWQATGRACLIFIDQEGGRVARLRGRDWPRFEPPRAFGALFEADSAAGLEACYTSHRLMAAELADMGIHADCAPVLDLSVPGAHDVIGDRAFSDRSDTIIKLARTVIDAFRDGGVAPVIKHLPGHGRARVDSHVALPRVEAGMNELSAKDFAPFEAMKDAPMAMTAHIAYDALDSADPATLSKSVIQKVIRERIGFQGLLMTDDLGMEALGGSLANRAERALTAGCDVVLHCAGFVKTADDILNEMRQVAAACPELSGQSLLRASRAEASTMHATAFDLEAGWARLNELMPKAGEAA